MVKRILIFGGGENQLTLIKAAKKLGVKSVVIDPKADAPGKNIADHFEVVGPSDYEHTREIALKYKVDGIVTGQTENPLMLMAQLAEDLGYIFPSREVIRHCRNKYMMKQAFIRHNIRCAKGLLLQENEKITQELSEVIHFPLIIKPVDAFSSRGVYKVMQFKDLIHLKTESQSFSSDGSILIEEYIEGPEFSVEAITFQGETTIIQYTEKIITSYPYTVEMGHIQPAELDDNQKNKINAAVTNAIKALGIDNSASHTELKLSKDGPVILEIGARLGGDYIASYLTLNSTGVDMDKAAIQIALGIRPDIEKEINEYSYIKYFELPVGKVVRQIGNWKELFETEDIVHAGITIRKNDIIPEITDSAKRPGFIIVKDYSREKVIKKAENICKKLKEYIKLN